MRSIWSVASGIAQLVLLSAGPEIGWLAEHGFEIDINVYDGDGYARAYAMIDCSTRERRFLAAFDTG